MNDIFHENSSLKLLKYSWTNFFTNNRYNRNQDNIRRGQLFDNNNYNIILFIGLLRTDLIKIVLDIIDLSLILTIQY